jgi:hypothetical protein
MPPVPAGIGGDFRKDAGKYAYVQFTDSEKRKSLSVLQKTGSAEMRPGPRCYIVRDMKEMASLIK